MKYPFKHLAAYGREDKAFYFGRKTETNKLYQMCFETDLILVYGTSGVGKSSLIGCGLANKFESYEWQDIWVRRGSNINDSLKEKLNRTISPENNETDIVEQIRHLRRKYFKPVYLIFDQFEELYISGTEEEQELFYKNIKTILSLNQPVKIIISIREEYLGYLYEFEKEVPQLFSHKYWVKPLKLGIENEKSIIDKMLQSVIDNKEESYVSIQDGDKDKLVDEITKMFKSDDKTVDLPSLQILFDEFYFSLTNDNTFSTPDVVFSYDKFKEIFSDNIKIQDILWKYLERLVSDLSRKEEIKSEVVYGVLLKLVTEKKTKKILTKKELQNEFSEPEIKLITDFFSDKNNILNRIEQKGEICYELRHDALAKCIREKLDNEIRLKNIINQKMNDKSQKDYLTEFQLEEIDKCRDRLFLREEGKKWVERCRRRRKIQKYIKRLGIFTLVILAVLGLLTAYYHAHETETDEYYADYVEKWGIPQGIISLKGDMLRNRHFRYHFIYASKGGKNIRLKRIIYEDNIGRPCVHENAEYLGRKDEASIEFIYHDKTNEVERVIKKNAEGKEIATRLTNKDKNNADEVKKQDKRADPYLLWVYEMDNINEVDAGNMFIYRDEKGYIKRIDYKNYGIQVINEIQTMHPGDSFDKTESNYGIEIEIDFLGRRKKITYLNEYGKQNDGENINSIMYEYDHFGNISKIARYKKNGKLIPSKSTWTKTGWAVKKDSADNYGNIIQRSFFDANENLQNKIAWKYSNGNKIEEAYFYANGRLIIKTVWKYDRKGNNIEEAYFDENDKPCKAENSYTSTYTIRGEFKATRKYNTNSLVIEENIYDTDNKLTYKINYEYDKQRNKTERTNTRIRYDEILHSVNDKVTDTFTTTSEYAHKTTWKYDKKGNVVEEAYFGDKNEGLWKNKDYAKITWEYDDFNNKIEEVYYDDTLGVSKKTTWKYEINGNILETATLSMKTTWKYDSLKNKKEEAYYNLDGTPFNNNGIAKKKWMYDVQRPIEKTYWDVDGNSVEFNTWREQGVDNEPKRGNFAKVTWKYNEQNHITEIAFWGIDGKPCKRLMRAKEIWEYDEWGNLLENAYFDTDGNYCLIRGIAKTTWKYDKKGRKIESATYDDKGKLSAQTSENWGNDRYIGAYKPKIEGGAKITVIYNEDGSWTKTFYNANGMAFCIEKHDEDGHKIEEAYFDEKGKPCKKYGVAQKTWKYDEQGHKIEEAYFDVDGKPCPQYDGVAKQTWKYDAKGNEIESACFGQDGKLCLPTEKNHNRFSNSNTEKVYGKRKIKYDHNGNKIEEIYYGKNDIPIQINKYGGYDVNLIEEIYFNSDVNYCDTISKLNIKYNDTEKKIEETFFEVNESGKLYLFQIKKYNDNGKLIEISFWGVDGNLFMKEGRAKIKYGKEKEETYFNADNKLIFTKKLINNNSIDKYIETGFKYDESGCLIEKIFTVTDDGYLKVENYNAVRDEYDENRNVIKTYFSIENNPCISEDTNYTKITEEYDTQGNIIRIAYIRADGSTCFTHDIYTSKMKYDEQNNCIETAYFGTDGKPYFYAQWGCAKYTMKYDERGNNTEVAYFGIDDKPILSSKFGYTIATMKYDEQNRHLETVYFGTDGNLVILPSGGYAKEQMKYDKYGNLVEHALFGADGKLVFVEENGYARLKMRYDKYRNQTFYACYDAQGKLCKPKDFTGVQKAIRLYSKNGEKLLCLYIDDKNSIKKEIKKKINFVIRTTFSDGFSCPALVINNHLYAFYLHKKFLPIFIMAGITGALGGLIFRRKKRRLSQWLCWGIAGITALTVAGLYGYLLIA
jgi:hypothetical protein